MSSPRKPVIIRNCYLVMLFAVFGLVVSLPTHAKATGQSSPGAARYVSAQGSDSKDGLSWSKAKRTIADAEKSCPDSGSCTIHVSSLRLSSPVVLNHPDTAIQCQAGAIVSTAVERGAPIMVRANGVQITGCTFQYSSGVGNTVVRIPRSVSHITIAHNVFRNYLGHPGWSAIIYVGNRQKRDVTAAVTDVRITDNQFLNIDPDAINLQDDVSRVTIANNVIVTDVSNTPSPTINAQTSDPGTMLESISVLNNSITKGTNNDCVQIQNLAVESGLGNSRIQNVTVSGNTCSLQPHAGAGRGATGFSMVGIAGLRETGNLFEGRGQAISGNAPFEIVDCSRATSSQNVAKLGEVTQPVVTAFTVIGTQYLAMRDVVLTGDSVSMAMHGTAHGSCYHVYAGQEAKIEGVTMKGNSCNLSGSITTGTVRGIWIQSNGRGAVMQGGTISGNVITGSRRAAVIGIHFAQNAGTISGWRIEQNQFRNTRRDIVGRPGGRL